MRWKVELSRSAVAALRALPREEQERVAARIRHLEEGGLPARGAREPEPGGDGGPRGGDPAGGAGSGPGSTGKARAGPGPDATAVSGGPDPLARREGHGDGGVRLVPAGDHFLVCTADPGEGTIVVVTLRPQGAGATDALGSLTLRWFRSLMGGGEMEALVQDVRFALRSLAKSPAFSTVAVLTLALGIGAATAIYSVADGVLFEPLPYEDPAEVVTVWASWDNFPDKTWLSVEEYQLFHQENRTLEDLALYFLGSANFTSVDNPEQVGVAGVTPNLFEVLGRQPVMGRVFTWEEAREPEPPVLLAWETWQRRWGGDPSLVGRSVEIDGRQVTVLGVLPDGFVLPVDFGSVTRAEVFFPFFVDLESPAPELGTGGNHGAYGVGRLRDGSTVEETRSDLERVMATMVPPQGLYAPERRFTPRVFAAADDIVGTARGTILLLLGAVALVLLIACGNVANLLLARSRVRMGEVAVRTALGAGRARILRQLLTEAAVLAVAGGALGVVLAGLGVRALLAVDPAAVPRSASVGVDGSVMAFALVASLVTALVFGVVPALRVARAGTAGTLHEVGRGGAVAGRGQGLLIASQMAMAVILLTASGLTVRTFVRLLEVDPGFQPQNVLTFRVTAPAATYPDTTAVVGFYEELLRRVREVPGVRAAGGARLLPLASTMGDAGFFVEGYTPAPNESTQAEWQWATPGYLEVMGIPLLAGRTLEAGDRPGAQEVVVINASVARHYWGEESPLGARVRIFGEDVVVVGVVGDVAHNGLTGERKERFYRPHAQVNSLGSLRSLTLTVGAEADPRGLLEPLRQVVRELDPTLPMAQVQTMDEVLSSAVARPRFAMVLLGAFAAIALTLAVVGIYGVLSYAASRRTREIGIRMALGAEGGQVVGLLVTQGMVMAAAGVVAGTAAALVLSRFMEGMLYGVEPTDPATFTLVPALFAAVALVACWVPAARAARVDPVEALRQE